MKEVEAVDGAFEGLFELLTCVVRGFSESIGFLRGYH